ncbi:hypothetical protein MKZ38_009984 [Zalerion maritima]|uniref:Uncharacterized protein n=1 Tax=Zalerion maritima TaxID=339359 RepID=A0AAD5RUI8_9PEZI|nr:hypothetical protein MKZ38_009984 [Zalerion maritima]
MNHQNPASSSFPSTKPHEMESYQDSSQPTAKPEEQANNANNPNLSPSSAAPSPSAPSPGQSQLPSQPMHSHPQWKLDYPLPFYDTSWLNQPWLYTDPTPRAFRWLWSPAVRSLLSSPEQGHSAFYADHHPEGQNYYFSAYFCTQHSEEAGFYDGCVAPMSLDMGLFDASPWADVPSYVLHLVLWFSDARERIPSSEELAERQDQEEREYRGRVYGLIKWWDELEEERQRREGRVG